jgi:hypothetical protein
MELYFMLDVDANKARRNKKMIAGRFDPEVSVKLREIASQENTSVQALLEEAIFDLLAKRALGSEVEPDVRQRMGRVNRTFDQALELMLGVQEEMRRVVFE